MARASIQQKDGNILDPGTWVHLTANDGTEYVGRFSGVYENPRLGWMYYLSFARPTDGSKPAATFFWRMTDDNGAFASLENAVQIEKPKTKGGKPTITPLVPSLSTVH